MRLCLMSSQQISKKLMSHLQSQYSQMEFQLSQDQEKSDSNLLDSTPSPTPSRFPQPQSKHSDDQEFLGNMEEVLGSTQNTRKMSNLELLLQAQVIELQMKCNSLAAINAKLVGGLTNGEEEGEIKSNNSIDNSQLAGDITQMQTEFCEIEDILNSYRTQLTAYQQQISKQDIHREELIDSLNQEIRELERENYVKEKECAEHRKIALQASRENQLLHRDISLLRKKNQDLIIEIEGIGLELERLQEKERVGRSNHQYSSEGYEDNEVILQMENMIDELASQLEHERTLSKKYMEEIKRVNLQLQGEAVKIQKKNQDIFQLERELLTLRKAIINDQYARNQEQEAWWGQEINRQPNNEQARKSMAKDSEGGVQKPFRHMIAKTEETQIRSDQTIEDKKIETLENSKVSLFSNFNASPIRGKQPTKKPFLSPNGNTQAIDEQVHRKTLNQLVQEGCSPLVALMVSKKIIELYAETEQKNHNRISMYPQNVQAYNIFHQNIDLLRVRVLHSHPDSVCLSKEDYLLNTVQLLLTLADCHSVQKVESLLQELLEHPLNAKARSMTSHFTYVRLAIDSAISRLKKEQLTTDI